MPDFASGDVCVIFGDPKSYKVRVSRELTIEKTGLHVLTDQVSWVGFGRFDGALIRLDGLKGLKKEA
jgi:HK97 family phage major capsid protein